MPEVTRADLLAMIDVLGQVAENSEDQPFENAVETRRCLRNLIGQAQLALSLVETDMLRQVERHARTVNGVTYVRQAVRSSTTDHERVLSMAYDRALQEATQPDGNVDWGDLGDKLRDIIVALYLSPSTEPKRGGLDYIGVKKGDVTDTVTKRYALGVIGEGE